MIGHEQIKDLPGCHIKGPVGKKFAQGIGCCVSGERENALVHGKEEGSALALRMYAHGDVPAWLHFALCFELKAHGSLSQAAHKGESGVDHGAYVDGFGVGRAGKEHAHIALALEGGGNADALLGFSCLSAKPDAFHNAFALNGDESCARIGCVHAHYHGVAWLILFPVEPEIQIALFVGNGRGAVWQNDISASHGVGDAQDGGSLVRGKGEKVVARRLGGQGNLSSFLLKIDFFCPEGLCQGCCIVGKFSVLVAHKGVDVASLGNGERQILKTLGQEGVVQGKHLDGSRRVLDNMIQGIGSVCRSEAHYDFEGREKGLEFPCHCPAACGVKALYAQGGAEGACVVTRGKGKCGCTIHVRANFGQGHCALFALGKGDVLECVAGKAREGEPCGRACKACPNVVAFRCVSVEGGKLDAGACRALGGPCYDPALFWGRIELCGQGQGIRLEFLYPHCG